MEKVHREVMTQPHLFLQAYPEVMDPVGEKSCFSQLKTTVNLEHRASLFA